MVWRFGWIRGLTTIGMAFLTTTMKIQVRMGGDGEEDDSGVSSTVTMSHESYIDLEDEWERAPKLGKRKRDLEAQKLQAALRHMEGEGKRKLKKLTESMRVPVMAEVRALVNEQIRSTQFSRVLEKVQWQLRSKAVTEEQIMEFLDRPRELTEEETLQYEEEAEHLMACPTLNSQMKDPESTSADTETGPTTTSNKD